MEATSTLLASLSPPKSGGSGKHASKGEPGSSREATKLSQHEDETPQDTRLGALGCYFGRGKLGLMEPEYI